MTETDKTDERIALIDQLEQEVKSRPTDIDLQRRLGWAYYGKGRFQEAQRVLEDAAARAKGDIEILYALGMAAKMSGEKAKARGIFESLREISLESLEDTRRAMLKRMAEIQILLLERD